MLLGCIVCALGFMLAYARAVTHEFVEGRARVIRSRFHAIVLRHALQSNALTCLQLNGAPARDRRDTAAIRRTRGDTRQCGTEKKAA
jgi:hypothetical protein